MQRSHLILIDDREKTPLPFPAHLVVRTGPCPWHPGSATLSLSTTSRRLETGDYVLASHPAAGCVERKAHLSELAGNLFDEKRYRLFAAEMDRLRSTFTHPLLLVEGSPTKTLPTRPGLPPPEVVLDALYSLLSRYTIPVLFLDASTPQARRMVGAHVARHLIHAAQGVEPCTSNNFPSPSSRSTPT